MSTTNQNNKPLYKVLDEQRASWNNWRVDKRENPESSNIPFAITIPGNGYCEPIFDSAAFPPNDKINLLRMEANAEYTCLAVNNLSPIAEALQQIVSNLSVIGGDDLTIAEKSCLNIAKEALSKIS